ncbi:MAG: GNAT family N-acetyltransferase, partial [Candidatus Latescibacteria bacterium]|nr:GNAT family N-acetyltransferase [Candidatus Latescibacterota bacterium]
MATFSKMTVENGPEATRLLRMFLQMDTHYLDSSAQYGDGGDDALDRAIALFLSTEHLGFIWMGMEGSEGIGVCVVSLAISTSAGSLVAKLDDVYVVPQWQGKGMGTALMTSLVDELKRLH